MVAMRPKDHRALMERVMRRAEFNFRRRPKQDCRILNLPAELRNHIYELVLTEECQSVHIHKHLQEPALVATCFQIPPEARGMWYALSKFHIAVVDCDARLLIAWRAKMQGSGLAYGGWKLVLEGQLRWANLIEWCRAIREGKAGRLGTSQSQDRNIPWAVGIIYKAHKIAEEYKNEDWSEFFEALGELKRSDRRVNGV